MIIIIFIAGAIGVCDCGTHIRVLKGIRQL